MNFWVAKTGKKKTEKAGIAAKANVSSMTRNFIRFFMPLGLPLLALISIASGVFLGFNGFNSALNPFYTIAKNFDQFDEEVGFTIWCIIAIFALAIQLPSIIKYRGIVRRLKGPPSASVKKQAQD